MPPFWKSLLGGSSSSSSSSSSASTAIPGVSSSNSSNSISNSNSNNRASPSTSTSSLSSPRKGQSSTAASAARPSSSSSLSSSTAASNGSRQQQQPQAQPQPSMARSSPIVIPGNSPHAHAHAHAPVSTSAASGGAAGSNAGIPMSQQTSHQHSTSIASSSALSSSTSYADDTDDASIPETPYSTGHSPSHARHKFPQDSSNHHTHHGSNGKQADGRQAGGRADSSGSGADTNDDEADTYLSDDEDEDSQGDPKQPQAGSRMGTSFASMSSSTTSSSSGVPNARQSPLKPDIPTTHTILANPLPQPSSGLAAAISSVLPSSSSSSNTNNSSNGSSSTAANIASPNGKAGSGSAATASAAGGIASDTAGAGPRTFDIDDMISRLLETGYSGKISKSVSLKNSEITALCLAAREVFLSQPTLLELSPPVNIVGDVHGQYSDLIRLFEMCSFPPQANYLFLGDYVDRGKQSLETILLLLCYKVKYPENFFLLRGNHECANVTRVYGFYDECKRRCNLKIWKTFVDVFNCLPIAALVAGKIFCVHGGLSPSLSSMDDIRRISRPTDVPDYGLLNDLLWSDPSDTALDWEDNERGVSYCFGKAVIQEFLAKYDFDLICRAHMVVEDGYEFWNDRTLVTIFSAPNYCGEFDNFASSMLVNEDLLCSFELLKPLDGAALKKELAKCRKKNSAGLLLPRPTA